MQAIRPPRFENERQERLYNYVERNGSVDRRELADVISTDETALRESLSALREEGLLETHDGRVRLSIDIGDEVAHEVEEFAYTIRPARQSDLGGLVGTMRAVSEEAEYLVAETVVDMLDHEKVVFRNNDLSSRVFFVATVDDEVVGWVHLESPNFAKLRHTAELTMGVRPECRGRGIGSNLMERGLHWAEANGYEKVYQSIPATNQDAIRFLEDHRWETEAIRRAHFKIDDQYVAEQMMAVMLG
ncbi:GNAT family N-acetyltransferase [Halovivax sp.]|uniref:GNAT family N-acetyltransferase n=1 Tax=Halovivax sp. TaxID=1935978 RepID=UPI0025C55C6C|nr:GNAT family N-acetyltransferase [Halovivax sp.]